jgi:NADPH2:quinone reductase
LRACVLKEFGPVDNLTIEEVADPVPGAGEVLVDVRAAGITFADLLIIQGKYQALPPLPFVPGQEVSGVVSAVGAGVDRLKPGMRVMGFAPKGAYAERVVVPQRECFVLPESVSFGDGAALGIAYQTAHLALMDRGQYREGETVLVNGASGGVGLACVQLAKAKGATVLAGLTTPAKAPRVTASGADHVIDLSAGDIAKSLRDQVFAVTGGRGANIVLDMIGGDVFDASLRALAWRGRAVVLGFVGGRIAEVKSNYLLIKNIAVSGLYWDSYRKQAPDEVRAAQEELFQLHAAGKLKPFIMETLPLEQVKQAFGRISKREVVGRVLIDPTRK